MSTPPIHSPTPTPTKPPPTFHLFPSLPFELRDQILLTAAGYPPLKPNPQIHFFLLNPPSFPSSQQPIQIYPLPDEAPLSLTPHPTSGAHNTLSLSLACRAAYHAVCRAQQALRKQGHGIVLGSETSPRMGLVLDLSVDLVCFLGGPGGEGNVLRDVIGQAEGSHLLFGVVRRFAVRYVPGWSDVGGPPLAHGSGCPAGWWGSVRGREDWVFDGFCSRCVAMFVERFKRLEQFWLIVDGKDLGGRVEEEAGERTVFEAYGRRYFSPDMCMVGAGAREASEVLDRVQLNMVRRIGADFSYTLKIVDKQFLCAARPGASPHALAVEPQNGTPNLARRRADNLTAAHLADGYVVVLNRYFGWESTQNRRWAEITRLNAQISMRIMPG